MLDLMPAGAVALEPAELDTISGGGFWRSIVAVAAVGFSVGRWLGCAFQCLGIDA